MSKGLSAEAAHGAQGAGGRRRAGGGACAGSGRQRGEGRIRGQFVCAYGVQVRGKEIGSELVGVDVLVHEVLAFMSDVV